jgi:hypothetical protein
LSLNFHIGSLPFENQYLISTSMMLRSLNARPSHFATA